MSTMKERARDMIPLIPALPFAFVGLMFIMFLMRIYALGIDQLLRLHSTEQGIANGALLMACFGMVGILYVDLIEMEYEEKKGSKGSVFFVGIIYPGSSMIVMPLKMYGAIAFAPPIILTFILTRGLWPLARRLVRRVLFLSTASLAYVDTLYILKI